jgi:hypothetical protein
VGDRKTWQEILIEVDAVLAEAKTVTNFRKYFNRWIETKEGKAVKAKIFTQQEGKCIKCNGTLQIARSDGVLVDHSEVHHLAPLALLQRYAEANPQIELATLRVFVTSHQYLRLVHPLCNKQFGEQVGDLSELEFLRDFLRENKSNYGWQNKVD